MAGRDGSVAPRERINIRYKTDTNGQLEERELPFKMLVLGDFTGRADATPVEERETIRVDAHSLDAVMSDLDVSLAIDVKDVISGEEGRRMPVRLELDSLKSFSPDEIARQIPELRRLLEIRNALKALKGPLGSDRAFRRRLASILEDESAIDDILAQVAPGADPEEAANDPDASDQD